MKSRFLTLAILALSSPAAAGVAVSVALTAGTADSVESVTYACENGRTLSAQYVNAGANALAVLPLDGEDRVFVNVVSASGARYVSGAYVWWVKGGAATLENTLGDARNTTCQST